MSDEPIVDEETTVVKVGDIVLVDHRTVAIVVTQIIYTDVAVAILGDRIPVRKFDYQEKTTYKG